MAIETLLAGDLGGTKTLLALVERSDGRPLLEQRFENTNYSGLNDVLHAFLSSAQAIGMPPPMQACLGVAGPVKEGIARITNLSWQVSEKDIARAAGVPRVCLINDFEAIGHGLDGLGPGDVIELQEGRPRADGVRAIIGAGTGLGEAIAVSCTDGWKILPTEGAHADFAPRDEFEAGLWQWLRQRFGHVSYERISSGEGLLNVFTYMSGELGLPVSDTLDHALREADPAAVISEFGMQGRDVTAVRALEVFVSVFGAEAGNLALKCLPYGGVYLAGGIAPKLADAIKAGGFVAAFRDKGRFSGLMADFPIRLVNNPRVGLLGAIRVARQLSV